jgi:hypothetical protein
VTIVRHRLTILNRTTTLHPIRSHLLHRRRPLSNSSSRNSSILRLTILSNSSNSNITNNLPRNSTTQATRRRQAPPSLCLPSSSHTLRLAHRKSSRTTWRRYGTRMTPGKRQSTTSTTSTTIRAMPPRRP